MESRLLKMGLLNTRLLRTRLLKIGLLNLRLLKTIALAMVVASCTGAGAADVNKGATQFDQDALVVYEDASPAVSRVATVAGAGAQGCQDSDAPDASQAPSTVATDTFTIAVAGDIMMGTTFPDSVRMTYLPANGGRDLLRDAAPIFQSADVAAANLEGVLMGLGGTPRPMTNPKTYFIFRMPPEYVTNLTDAGIDLMSIASNHTNDLTAGGRESTQRVLGEAGIGYAGLKTCRSTVIERAGKKIGFAAFGHADNTCHNWEYDEVKEIISDLDKRCDYVIVSFHGGAEGTAYEHVPFKMETYVGEKRGDVARFARLAVDAGADLVYGHGPHVVRGMELYNGHLILYSLGNFCTPTRLNISGLCGYAPVVTARLDSEGRFIDGRIHSMIQQPRQGPRTDAKNIVARHMRCLSEADFPHSPLRIADDGTLSVVPAQK